MRENREVPVVIVEHVHFHGTFRLPELCPGKQRQAQLDEGSVHADQAILEPEGFAASKVAFAPRQDREEEVLIDLPWSVLVGVC